MFVRSSNFFWTRLLSLSAFGYYMYHHNVQNYNVFLYIMLRPAMIYIYIRRFQLQTHAKKKNFLEETYFFAQQKLHSSARFNNSWYTAMDSSVVTSHVKQARRKETRNLGGGKLWIPFYRELYHISHPRGKPENHHPRISTQQCRPDFLDMWSFSGGYCLQCLLMFFCLAVCFGFTEKKRSKCQNTS